MHLIRLLPVFALLAVTAPALAQGQPAPAPTTPPAALGVQTVDQMNKMWGRHPGLRANHAKGVVAEGNFVPTPEAKALSAAAVFAGPSVPMTVRFSDGSGLPKVADASPDANPHGMSMRFRPANSGGRTMDVVSNALPFFPVATSEEFLQLLQAAADSPASAPKPTKLEQFIQSHPQAPKALGAVGTPPSFAQEQYNGVNAFVFVNAAGVRQPFRFRFMPVAGVVHLKAEDAAKLSADALLEELPQRVAKEPVAFRVQAQLANPGDSTRDPSQPWPDDRRVVDLGTITLTATPADQAAASANLRLLPSNLLPGVEPSDDPMIDARVRSYVVSFGRRVQ